MELTPLYGVQTRLATENFPVSGRPLDLRIVHAIAEVKAACARANASTGVLADDMATAIDIAARSVASGAHDDQFPVDTFQTGSGTSSNMNVNEVVAALAAKTLGIDVHPNDDVNASQSSNDVFPTAAHVAAMRDLRDKLLPALTAVIATLDQLAEREADSVKTGRTHLMDAVPVTVGQEFSGHSAQLHAALRRVEHALDELAEVPLGGTAVGTGLNAPDGFREAAVAELARLTELPLRPASNAFAANAARDALVAAAAAQRGVAIVLTKVANDLRWMGSGPTAGLGEIRLPALQAGSSIMPGKVNPVIPEAVLQVCARVVGNDAAVAWAGASGSFEITVAMPVMADAVLESSTLLARAMTLLDERCLRGIEVDRDALAERAGRSPALATALNRLVGYERAAAVVHQAEDEGVPLAAMVARLVERDELPAAATSVIDPLRLAWPHGRANRQTDA